MKNGRTRIRLIANLLVIALAFGYMTLAAGAIDMRSSDCISSYSGLATRSRSNITVTFDITARSTMSTLGAAIVVIEKSTSNGWTPVYTFYSSSTSGMTGSNTAFHGGQVTYTGNSSDTYRAKITFYAANSSKSDSKLLTTNSV